MTTPAADVLQSLLADSRVGWSVGRTGAIAEFYWDAGEPVSQDVQSIITSRGALEVRAFDQAGARLFAGESLTHEGRSWSQWLSLCLPKVRSGMRASAVIAAIGRDGSALRPPAPHAVLFDLGIGGPFFQVGVLAESPELIAELHSGVGEPLLNNASLVRSLVALSPTRVFESKLARIEVAQPIAMTGGRSPEGPHTHLLPDLLQGDGADSPSAPAGWVAQVVAYPAHPERDARGKAKRFDRIDYDAFQRLLNDFGDPGHQSVKRAVFDAVRSGVSPRGLELDDCRRDSMCIALRQLARLDGESAALDRWRAIYDAP